MFSFPDRSFFRRRSFWMGAAVALLGLAAAIGLYRWASGPQRDTARRLYALKSLDLSPVDTAFPLAIMAPENAVAGPSEDGFSPVPELCVRDSAAGFGVRISRNEFFGVTLDEVIEAEKERLSDQYPAPRFLREEPQGFVYEQVWGDRAVYDFLYVARRGDRYFYFQVAGLGPYSREQVEAMYECVDGL
jgi:hypothetical protein